MSFDSTKWLLSTLVVLAVLFCAIAATLYVRHVKMLSKKEGWTISLQSLGDASKSASSQRLYAASDEELTQMRQRLERKAWEVAQQRENEAARREGRQPVEIVAGSDLPAILKYVEQQKAKENDAPAPESKSQECFMDTASLESLTKSLGHSAWMFSSTAWGGMRLEFYEDGGYMTSRGAGRWSVELPARIGMTNSVDGERYNVTVSTDGKRFEGRRSDGLVVSGDLICATPQEKKF